MEESNIDKLTEEEDITTTAPATLVMNSIEADSQYAIKSRPPRTSTQATLPNEAFLNYMKRSESPLLTRKTPEMIKKAVMTLRQDTRGLESLQAW